MIGEIDFRPHVNPPPSTAPRVWFEDLHVGREFVSREYEITETEVVAFARHYDPQPFHIDPVAARETFFEGLAASGWHTAAVTMRLVAESLPLAGGIVGAGTDHLSWPRATRPGDRLHVKSVVESLRPLRSKPDRGLVIFRCTTCDHRDDPVQILMPKLFVPLRDYTAASPA
jgi:acyl dehydratase